MGTVAKGLVDTPPDWIRRRLLVALAVGSMAVALPLMADAQESGGGKGKGGGGESGGGHSGGGGESGGGESGGGHGAGRTPAQRAVRHRQRTGRTLGGGESTGGSTGGTGRTGANHIGGATQIIPDGSTTGPIGGDAGGEHFVHEGQGGWGADSKVLRRP